MQKLEKSSMDNNDIYFKGITLGSMALGGDLLDFISPSLDKKFETKNNYTDADGTTYQIKKKINNKN